MLLHAHHSRLAFLPLISCVVVSGSAAQNQAIPPKNWTAPPYWQPTAKESAIMKRAARAQPEDVSPEAIASEQTPPLVFVGVTPCRMMDTRGFDSTFTGAYGSPPLSAGSTRTLPVAGVTAGYCSLPSTALAVSLNVTIWPNAGTRVQWLSLWPAGQAQPVVSTLNDYQGTVFSSANGVSAYGINNAAIVPLGTGGALNVYVTDATNLFIDVNGYYAAIGDVNGNTMLGIGALQDNVSVNNTATGNSALQNNTTGTSNTANGNSALLSNTTGNGNTATGADALYYDTTGTYNTANGAFALENNTIGNSNTAVGYQALSTGNSAYNTAVGYKAASSASQISNTAVGYLALAVTTTGGWNTAIGTDALEANTTGSYNVALGVAALESTITGTENIGIGYGGGNMLTTGSNNIAIGNTGAGADSGVIRIGTQGTQTSTYIAGIYGASGTGTQVYATPSGQLFTASSSRRFKQDIRDIGDTTELVMGLRPVRFRYRALGPDSPEHYGLIAEDVQEVAPELVGHGQDGQIDSVYYDKVYAILLNQVQTQQRLIASQKAELQSQLESQKAQFTETLRQLESRLAKVEGRSQY